MNNLFDQLVEYLEALSGSPWFYLAILAIAFLDSVFPIVPSETTVILGGAAAGAGELSIPIVLILAASGAFMGDSLAYTLGSRFSEPIQRFFFRGKKGPERVSSLGRQISKRGGLLLVTARFIPGGRTALTITCGITQPGRSRSNFVTGRRRLVARTAAARAACDLAELAENIVNDRTIAVAVQDSGKSA